MLDVFARGLTPIGQAHGVAKRMQEAPFEQLLLGDALFERYTARYGREDAAVAAELAALGSANDVRRSRW